MPEPRGKYSLDELLRNKRNEKPNPSFWTGFDREFKDRQRQLIQKQLAKETNVGSLPSRRLLRFGAFATTMSFAAFAVFIGVRNESSDNGGIAKNENATPEATFTVASSDSVSSESVGLKEFATLATTPTPRLVVRSIPRTAQPDVVQVVASTAPVSESRIAASDALAEFGFSFASTAGLVDEFAIGSTEDTEVVAGISRLEQALALGKYADPLDTDFSRSFDPMRTQPVTSGRLQNASFSELDDMLSSQGSRRSRSIDALTLKF